MSYILSGYQTLKKRPAAPVPRYSNVREIEPCARLQELSAAGLTIGKSVKLALKSGDTSGLLMDGAPSFSGDDITVEAQYGYDRFQRAQMAHASTSEIANALEREEEAMSAETTAAVQNSPEPPSTNE